MSSAKRLATLVLITVLSLSACITAPVFNEAAYAELCELKVLSSAVLAVMLEEAVKSESDQSDVQIPAAAQEEIKNLKMRIAVAYEYARNRPENEEQVKQFDILMNEEGDMLYALIKSWESDEYISPFYIENSTENIRILFDVMLALESGKEIPES